MFKKVSAILFILISFSTAGFAAENEPWNSAEGLKRLENSQYKNDFYQLANFYQPQENPLFCSIATATMILNAFNYGNIASQKEGEVKRPEGGVFEYHLYSQKGFFNEQTETIKKRATVELKAPAANNQYDAGLTMDAFSKMLSKGHKLKVEVTNIEKNDAATTEKFRELLKKYLAENKHFVAVNFDGKVIGHKTRGHISPVVAFDEKSDSVLVLDAALHKNQWFWAPLPKLLEAMNTKDGDAYRGYLLIGK